jgi:16S rRNA C1402 N4-methylase RsmH
MNDEDRYAIRIVNLIKKHYKIETECDTKELTNVIKKVFIEYGDKIKSKIS